MKSLGICLIIIGFLFAAFMLVMEWRNQLTYRTRVRVIYENHALYEHLPSYDAMMLDFRKWSEMAFIREAQRRFNLIKGA